MEHNVKMGCSAATIICVGAGATQYVPSPPLKSIVTTSQSRAEYVDSSSIVVWSWLILRDSTDGDGGRVAGVKEVLYMIAPRGSRLSARASHSDSVALVQPAQGGPFLLD